jgi:uncharacterized protein (DUF2384 family)
MDRHEELLQAATDVLETQAEAQVWPKSPCGALDGRTPEEADL